MTVSVFALSIRWGLVISLSPSLSRTKKSPFSSSPNVFSAAFMAAFYWLSLATH
jgi:hypothetical protein